MQPEPDRSRRFIWSAGALIAAGMALLLSAPLAGLPAEAGKNNGCHVPANASDKDRSGGHDCRPAEPEQEPSVVVEEPEPEATAAPEGVPTEEALAFVAEVTATPTLTPTASPTPTVAPPPTTTPPAAVVVAIAPTETPTPSPTATQAPTATPVPAPSPAPPRIAEVQAAVITVPPLNFLAGFPAIGDLSTDIGVVGTNFSLALATVLLVLVAATLFNTTLKENGDVIGAYVGRLKFASTPSFALPLTAIAGPSFQKFSRLRHLRSIVLLGATAVIYSALDPHFGFNDSSLVLILGIMAGLTLTTFLYEGGQVMFSSRVFGLPAAMRAYPVAVVIAVASVALSRVIELSPGVIFGFVAAAVLTGSGIGRREQGIIVFVPMLGLLAVSFIALILIGPLRDMTAGKSGVLATLPETIAVAVFVGGAQSLLLSLIPLTFNDGQRVWTWNRIAWFALALPAGFLFFHVIVHREGSFDSVTDGAGALAPLIGAVVFLAVAAGLWLFFRIKQPAGARA